MSTTRKMFRFFKHLNSLKSIKNNYSDLKQHIKKFKNKFLHDIQGAKNDNGQDNEIESENILENKSKCLKRTKSNEEIKIIEQTFYRDSKRQLISRIIYSLCKLSSSILGFCYYFADHLSFLTKIEVITDPSKRKVNLYNV